MLCKALKGEKKIKSARANAQAQKSQKKEDSFYRAVTTYKVVLERKMVNLYRRTKQGRRGSGQTGIIQY